VNYGGLKGAQSEFMVAFVDKASVATHQVLFIISCTYWSAFSGWGTASSIRIGHAIGANKLHEANKKTYRLGAYFILICIVIALATSITSDSILSIFAADDKIIQPAQNIWFMLSIFIFLDLLQSFVVTILQTYGEAKRPFLVHLIVLTFFGSLAVFILVSNGFGLSSIWGTLCICMSIILIQNSIDLKRVSNSLLPKKT